MMSRDVKEAHSNVIDFLSGHVPAGVSFIDQTLRSFAARDHFALVDATIEGRSNFFLEDRAQTSLDALFSYNEQNLVAARENLPDFASTLLRSTPFPESVWMIGKITDLLKEKLAIPDKKRNEDAKKTFDISPRDPEFIRQTSLIEFLLDEAAKLETTNPNDPELQKIKSELQGLGELVDKHLEDYPRETRLEIVK